MHAVSLHLRHILMKNINVIESKWGCLMYKLTFEMICVIT